MNRLTGWLSSRQAGPGPRLLETLPCQVHETAQMRVAVKPESGLAYPAAE